MLPYQIIGGGSFTSDATVARQTVQVTDEPDLIWVRNRTAWGDDAAETSVESWWRRGMAQDSAQTTDQANASGILSSEAVTTQGFRIYNTTNPPTYAALASTAVTAANPAVVSMANTGTILVGDTVRMYNVAAMQQISSLDFTVSAVTTNVSITLGNLNASAFAAAGTTGFVLKFIPSRFYPRWRYITAITQAASAVITTSVTHDFTVGEKVSFRVPSQFGMDEINNLTGTVTAITTTVGTNGSTVTVDIDSSGFTAFAFPTSAIAAAGISNAVIVPAGSGPIPNANPPAMNINAAFDNRNQWLIEMGSNVITSTSAVYDWVAFKYDLFTAL